MLIVSEMLGIILTSTMMLKLSLSTLYTSLSHSPKLKVLTIGSQMASHLSYSTLFQSWSIHLFLSRFSFHKPEWLARHSKKSNLASSPGLLYRPTHLVLLDVKPRCQGPWLDIKKSPVLFKQIIKYL